MSPKSDVNSNSLLLTRPIYQHTICSEQVQTWRTLNATGWNFFKSDHHSYALYMWKKWLCVAKQTDIWDNLIGNKRFDTSRTSKLYIEMMIDGHYGEYAHRSLFLKFTFGPIRTRSHRRTRTAMEVWKYSIAGLGHNGTATDNMSKQTSQRRRLTISRSWAWASLNCFSRNLAWERGVLAPLPLKETIKYQITFLLRLLISSVNSFSWFFKSPIIAWWGSIMNLQYELFSWINVSHTFYRRPCISAHPGPWLKSPWSSIEEFFARAL